MPNYVPGDKPTVPGHETVVRIVKVGPGVTRHKVGERYLVQTDYRWLPTASSNSAFGYNFEGALQEYVLLDERVITAPDGESMLIPAPEDLSASALALVEPWACVEDAYVEKQRQKLKAGGQMLVVGETPVDRAAVDNLSPGTASRRRRLRRPRDRSRRTRDASFRRRRLFRRQRRDGGEALSQGRRRRACSTSSKAAASSAGRSCRRSAASTTAASASSAPPAPTRRRPWPPSRPPPRSVPSDKINIIGAAGPMGTMHVIRDLCQGVPGVTVFAGDLERRASGRARRSWPRRWPQKNNVTLRTYNPSKDKPGEQFDYIVLMAPVPALVAQAVATAAPKAIINIFAGIPADVTAELDLDAYIAKQLYFIGTSGSTLDDMKLVLAKVVGAPARHQPLRRRRVRAWTARSTASGPWRRTSCPAKSSSIRPAAA